MSNCKVLDKTSGYRDVISLARSRLKRLSESSLLGTLAGLIMLIQIPLFLPFLKLDLSDGLMLLLARNLELPWLLYALVVKLIVFALLKGDEYIWLGLGMNALATLSLILPAKLTWSLTGFGFKRALLGAGLGTLVSTITMALANYWVIKLFLNSSAVEKMIVYGVLPFNLLRGILATAVFIALCKLLNYIRTKENSEQTN